MKRCECECEYKYNVLCFSLCTNNDHMAQNKKNETEMTQIAICFSVYKEQAVLCYSSLLVWVTVKSMRLGSRHSYSPVALASPSTSCNKVALSYR